MFFKIDLINNNIKSTKKREQKGKCGVAIALSKSKRKYLRQGTTNLKKHQLQKKCKNCLT